MRSTFIDNRLANRPLLDVLQTSFRMKRKAALDALLAKQVRICGGVCMDPARRVKVGQHIQLEGKSPHARAAFKHRGRSCSGPCSNNRASTMS